MIDKSSYKIFTDRVEYEPQGISSDKAIDNAGAISAFEKLPVYLKYNNMVVRVRVAKLEVERIR